MNFKISDQDTTTALMRIARSAEWEYVEKWLLSVREAAVQASLTTDSDAKSRQAQGVIVMIDEFIRNTRAAGSADRR